MDKLVLTICILEQERRVLLGLKKTGLGEGKWNAFGGKVEPGETPEAAAVREFEEECGVVVKDAEKAAVITFTAPNRPNIEMHVFKASEFSGEPHETDEMAPKWFYRDELPFQDMWPSDLYWFPMFFRGRKFIAHFDLDENDRVLHRELKEVADFS